MPPDTSASSRCTRRLYGSSPTCSNSRTATGVLMGRRDYELEAATAAVDGYISEPVVRALIVGAPGSQEGTLGGALKSLFGRSRRKSGLRHQNVLVLTPTSMR